jgi:hypothetical protein
MATFLEDLVTLIEDAGAGDGGVDLFYSTNANVPRLPSGEPTVHIIETGGTSPDHTQNSAIIPAYIQPAAQITVRADAYEDARARAEEVYLALNIRNMFVNSGWYVWIKPLQEPFDGGVDETGSQIKVQFNVIAKKGER